MSAARHESCAAIHSSATNDLYDQEGAKRGSERWLMITSQRSQRSKVIFYDDHCMRLIYSHNNKIFRYSFSMTIVLGRHTPQPVKAKTERHLKYVDSGGPEPARMVINSLTGMNY